MKIQATTTISFFVLLATLLHPTLSQTWGADSLAESYRPSRTFLTSFPTTPTVTVAASGSISTAIDTCDTEVGTGYCTIGVSGTPTQETVYITRSNTKIIGVDSAKLTGSGDMRFIQIEGGVEEVVIENLEIVGHNGEDVSGIVVEGGDIERVGIIGNKIHGFDGSSGGAQGIVVLGNSAVSVKEVIIEDNEIYEMKTGYSESLAVNGNVGGFEITGNNVYDVDNIAIDAIGGEGTRASTTDSDGRVLPHPDDAARYGFIEKNTVKNMDVSTNPAYAGDDEPWSAAIYIDGATNILIADNVVEDSSWGYEIGAENCVISQHITMTGNTATGSLLGDVVMGGYAETGYLADTTIGCDPDVTNDDDEGHGYVQHITVKDNTFETTTGSETGDEQFLFQNRITYAIVVEPNVTPVNADGDGSATGDENAIKTTE
eukprot:Plantae.Rhodophyta-Hildenbrandia_rubra.ctg10219.p1 GENE.Plantae.Rhodophyta-Hildenbrandia_rubra.ctg10219~~Plantae.Rhodophyta-Hildenbrandia_rubra.ctg10219.p1  ORF type:complete len:431 (-),score=92.65 Plantae.Rhodophyta-Hildenbrandia_rubra.ctg10219:837-2129(-)